MYRIVCVVIWIISASLSFAQDSWTHVSGVGKVVKISPEGKELFKYNVPSSLLLRLTASPAGNVLYLEEMDSDKSPETERRLKIHVCKESGEEIQSIVIKQGPNEYYNYATFHGESIIELYLQGRNTGGRIGELIAFGDSGKNFKWWPASGDSYSASFLPDKNKVLCIVSAPKWKTALVYLNGDLIYPQYRKCTEDGLIGVRSIVGKTQSASLPELMTSDPEVVCSVGQALFLCGEDSIWSPDGRYVALIEISSEFNNKVDSEEIKSKANLLVLDTEKAKPGIRSKEYTYHLPIGSPLSEHLKRNYLVKWNENGQRIQIMRKSESDVQPSRLLEEVEFPSKRKAQ